MPTNAERLRALRLQSEFRNSLCARWSEIAYAAKNNVEPGDLTPFDAAMRAVGRDRAEILAAYPHLKAEVDKAAEEFVSAFMVALTEPGALRKELETQRKVNLN